MAARLQRGYEQGPVILQAKMLGMFMRPMTMSVSQLALIY